MKGQNSYLRTHSRKLSAPLRKVVQPEGQGVHTDDPSTSL